MDSKEIAGVVESVSNEKCLPKEKVFEVLEYALAVAIKNFLDKGGDINVRVEINHKSCDYKAFRRWQVVDDTATIKPLTEITLSAAKIDNPDVKIGEFVEDEIDLEEAKSKKSGFARIAAQTAKNVIVQKIRDAEKERIIDSYKSLVGHLVQGTVKKKAHDYVMLDLGARQTANNAEAIMTRENWIKGESFPNNYRIRAVLLPINSEKNAQLSVSRSVPEFLKELIKSEVPEIADGFVEIKSVARESGVRSKVAVLSKDKRIDTIGCCIGMHQTRVNAILEELNGEKVDFVLWDDDPVKYVINAMSPAKILQVFVNEEKHTMDLSVSPEDKPLAIGKNGINVRLSSRLTGWNINVFDSEEYQAKRENRNKEIENLFINELNVDEDFASVLVLEGFETLEAIAYVDPSELTSIEGLSDDIAEALQTAAKEAIERGANKAKELLTIEGVDTVLASNLAAIGVCTKEDLAELATDDLTDIDGMTNEKASKLIMQARKDLHWFD